jgi:hypothetical protein
MALSDQEILDAATLEYQIELDRGLSLGEAEYPLEPIVRKIRPDQRIDSPVGNKVTIIFSEPDIELKKDTGEVPFRSLPLKERSLEVEPYVDGIAEFLRHLRQPLVRQHYAEYVNNWAGAEGGVRWTQYRQGWERLLRGNTATYGLAHDGQLFFDTDHPAATKDGTPTTYQNLFALALSEANLKTVIEAMLEFRTQAGLPYGNAWKSATMMTPQQSRETVAAMPRPSFHLFVGPSNAVAAHELARMSVDNPSKFAGSFTFSTISEISGSDAARWFVQFLDPRRKPLNFIDDGATLDVKDGYSTEPGRLKARAEWVLRAIWAFCYDRPDVISMSTGA